jgi:HK97 family phage major capsid protein
MAENQTAAGQPAAPVIQVIEDHEPRKSPLEVERERRTAIQELCKANSIDPRTEERWIMDGTPLTRVANQLLEVIEERGKAKPTSAAELGLSQREQQRYSWFRVLRMLSAQNGGDTQRYTAEAAYEIECSRSVAKQLGRQPDGIFVPADILRRPVAPNTRTMTAQPGSSGGYLVDVESQGFIDLLRNRSVLSSLGARTLSGLQGNVSSPRQSAAGTMAWQAGETATATAADQTLGQYSLTPKTAIAVTEVGRTLMMQSSPSAEAMVTADLARIVALGVDLAGLTGTGGSQPLGIENTPGVTTGQDGANATYAKMLAFQGVAAAANAMLGNTGYVTTPAVAAILMAKSRFANTDTPLWDGSINDGTMCGVRAMSSNQVTASHCIFGSWNELVIGEWGVLELTMNPYQSFNAGVVGIRAMYTVDMLVRYPAAFVVSASVTA